jgi:hypothetical protein
MGNYQLTAPGGQTERHSSSGLIVCTGTGATGWCASIALERGGRALPAPTDSRLAWFVREAWPSPITGTSLTEGVLEAGETLRVTVAHQISTPRFKVCTRPGPRPLYLQAARPKLFFEVDPWIRAVFIREWPR